MSENMIQPNSCNKSGQHSSWKIVRNNLCMHVTAIKTLGEILFVAEGNQVSVFNLNSKKIIESETVFSSSSIHGIRIDDHLKILFFGSKSLRVYSFDLSSAKCLTSFSEEIILFDWIFDVQWLTGSEKVCTVAIITAHNSLTTLDFSDKTKLKTAHCVENCILYSANIISSLENVLVVAVGTVFTEILLWSPNSASDINKARKPFHYLKGHKGVIFSVSYNTYHKLLSSTSDDRSVRLWKINSSSDNDSTLEFWKQCSVFPSHVLYAHESRVWTSTVLRNCVVSVGEDSSICFWNMDGQLLKKKKCHKDGSIWCLETNYSLKEHSKTDNCNDYIAITGGSDGGVYCWDIQNIMSTNLVSQISLHQRCSSEKDFPRVVSIICCNGIKKLMATTDKGWLSFYDISTKKWESVYHDASFVSYCISSISQNMWVALGNLSGDLVLLDCNENEYHKDDIKKFNIHAGKIFSLHWADQKSEHLLSCGAEGHMILWKIKFQVGVFSLDKLHEFHLPKCKPHWWSTAALYLPSSSSLIVGDRGGSITFYSPNHASDKISEPGIVHKSVHGENGVTDIKEHKSLIYSAGRDGRVLLYTIKQKSLKLLHAIKISHDLEWIGKMLFFDTDLLLLGFHTKYFIVWSTVLESTVMTVECGGGHRSWDFRITDEGHAIFTAIKKKDVIFALEDLNFTLKKSVLKSGVSGKEFCHTCYLFTTDLINSESMDVLAAGGEDNALQIIGFFTDSSKSSQIISLHSLSGHLSSIRSIAKSSMVEENAYLLASVGGRSQMILWKIKNNSYVECEQLAAYILTSSEIKNSKPTKGSQAIQFDPQTRLMDVTMTLNYTDEYDRENYIIALACSDSYFRVYNFDATMKLLSLCYNVQLGENCILKLSEIIIYEELNKNIFFITATTGGYLNFVNNKDLKSLRKIESSDSGSQEQNNIPHFKLPLHQSGINAIDVKHISGERWLVCTGGDDSALFILLVEIHSSSTQEDFCKILTKKQISSAHFSQITGVKILEGVIVSTSVDQRIHLWRWNLDSDSLYVTFDSSKISVIPDIANLECWRNGNDEWFAVVCGEGIERLSIKNVL